MKNLIEKVFLLLEQLIFKLNKIIPSLTKDHIDLMHEVFAEFAVSQFSNDCFFKMFTFDEFSTSKEDKDRKVIGEDLRKYLFEHHLMKLLPSSMSQDQFQCYETNFFVTNRSNRSLA